MSDELISFYEVGYDPEDPRAHMHKHLRELGLRVFHNSDTQFRESIPRILFYHEGDRGDLHPVKEILGGKFKIEYGARTQSPTASPWDADLVTRYINWQNVQAGIARFAKDVGALDQLDAQIVHALITKHFFDIDVDPKLEELLKPFATSSPFKAPCTPTAKADLDAYIAKKLGRS